MYFSPRNKQGFTLIELLVVVTIIGIISVASYIPYDHYSQISRLRISEEKVRQVFEDAKLLSQNGQLFPENITSTNSSNADIGVVITKSSLALPSHEVQVWAFRHGQPTRLIEGGDAKILKRIELEDGININALGNISDNSLLVKYNAPKGETATYKYNGNLSPLATGTIEIGIGYKTSTAGSLYRSITIRP